VGLGSIAFRVWGGGGCFQGTLWGRADFVRPHRGRHPQPPPWGRFSRPAVFGAHIQGSRGPQKGLCISSPKKPGDSLGRFPNPPQLRGRISVGTPSQKVNLEVSGCRPQAGEPASWPKTPLPGGLLGRFPFCFGSGPGFCVVFALAPPSEFVNLPSLRGTFRHCGPLKRGVGVFPGTWRFFLVRFFKPDYPFFRCAPFSGDTSWWKGLWGGLTGLFKGFFTRWVGSVLGGVLCTGVAPQAVPQGDVVSPPVFWVPPTFDFLIFSPPHPRDVQTFSGLCAYGALFFE